MDIDVHNGRGDDGKGRAGADASRHTRKTRQLDATRVRRARVSILHSTAMSSAQLPALYRELASSFNTRTPDLKKCGKLLAQLKVSQEPLVPQRGILKSRSDRTH